MADAGSRVVHVDATPVEITGTGIWCPACLLPGGIRLRIVVSPKQDPTLTISRFIVTFCIDCGHELEPRRR